MTVAVRPLGTSVFAAAAALALSLAGCAEDPVRTPAAEAGVRILVLDEEDRTGVSGVKVLLMETASNLPLGPPVVSDTTGVAEFPAARAGSYAVLAFGGARHRIVSLPRDATTADAADPVLVRELSPPAGIPRFAGTVVDAATDRPLDGAFLGLSPFLSGYLGETEPSDDVTGADGAFLVSEVPFAMDPISGEIRQVVPLLVVRDGYRPVAWRHEPDANDPVLDVTGVVVRLQALTGGEDGRLRGRLVRDGQPAADVQVGLGSLGSDPAKQGAVADEPVQPPQGVGLTGWAAVTDAMGEFSFTGLPAGRYLLHPGYLPRDGAVYLNQAGNVPYEVSAGEWTETPDLEVLHEIEPLLPDDTYRDAAPPGDLRWTAVPGAAGYRVLLGGRVVATEDTLAATAYVPPDLAPGLYSWGVVAYDAEGAAVGLTQVTAVFRILPADNPVN